MGAQAECVVRPLSMDEGRKLQKMTRSAKNPVRLRRAMVVMMSGLWGSRTRPRLLISGFQAADSYWLIKPSRIG